MKQNFFDELDGGWGDLIADTYKEANAKPVLDFPINVSYNPHPVTYNGKKVINVIIYESENMKNWVERTRVLSTVIIYNVYFCNIPLKSIRYILEDGTEITPKLLPDDKRDEVSKGKVSFRVKINQYIKDQEVTYLLSMSNSKVFYNHDLYKTCADGYILNNLNSTYEDESKPIGLHLDIINSLKEKGFDINNEQE